MTWNLAQTMSLIKAAQHKYTHRKLISRDPKTNRPRYRYYYARHHGGGITSAAFEAGSAFKLTFKGRRGHFHIQRVEGNKVFVKHDGRPGSKEVEMSQDELRALLEKQHSELETKGREKAQKRRKSAAKKRKSTKRTKSTKRKKTQTQTPREELTETAQQGADNFEAMPEELPDEPFEMRIARENIGKVQARLQAEREKGKTEHQLTKLNMMLESAREDYAIELAEYRAERETAQQAPQRSQTAQAFSSMVDTIKSGERSQKAQDAFKTELNKVIDKAESGTLTDAERAELLPIAEQLVEVTSGRARALMTAVRDQIKGSSEGGEVEEEAQSTRPQIKSREEAAEYLKESLLEELGEGHSVKVWRKERSGKSPIVRVYVQQKLRRGWSDMGYYNISDKGKVYPNFDRRPAGMRDLAAYIMQRADLDI